MARFCEAWTRAGWFLVVEALLPRPTLKVRSVKAVLAASAGPQGQAGFAEHDSLQGDQNITGAWFILMYALLAVPFGFPERPFRARKAKASAREPKSPSRFAQMACRRI